MKLFRKTSGKKSSHLVSSPHPDTDSTAGNGIVLYAFNRNDFLKTQISIEDCAAYKSAPPTIWFCIEGLSGTGTIEKFGELFGLHDLVLEDIQSAAQHPKIEDHEDYLFTTLKTISLSSGDNNLEMEQVSFILARNAVLSFQENPGEIFQSIRNRLEKPGSRIARHGPDYLLCVLIDKVVDNYFDVIEKLGEEIEGVEDEVLQNPDPETSRRIHAIRRKVILLRRSIWPVRDILNSLMHMESQMISRTTRPYLRDVHDHVIQIIETLEIYRDMLSSQLEVYLAAVNNRMNEIMKTLTTIATIFIPLGVVASIYGMNFKHMPELQWRYGYPLVLILMAAMAAGFLVYFKKKKWL